MKKCLLTLATVILCFILSISTGSAKTEDGLFCIYFVDVGQADAAIILCDDEVLMIDGGNKGDSSLIFSVLRNTLGIERINYMIATHPHEDHVGGLAGALNACAVNVLYTPVLDYDTKAFQSMMKYAQEQGTKIVVPRPGDTFSVGSASAEILAPLQDYKGYNDLSIVVRITYGETSFLFTGDIERNAELDLVEAGVDLSADVLKVSHHGSDTSSSYVFLREVMPAYAIISVGTSNSYDLPSENVLNRLRNIGAVIFRTDESGMIECISDGSMISFILGT